MSSFELFFRFGSLRFELRNHPLVETWSRMAEWYYHNHEYEREELAQNFSVMDYMAECERLRDMGQELLTRYPEHLSDDFSDIIDNRIYTRAHLNWLHEQYEIIRTHEVPFSLPEAVNDQIHVCERFHAPNNIIRSHIAPRPRIRTRFIHKEWKASAPWKLDYRAYDQELFEAPVSGRLYLCYCEVGKPPFSAYRDRDTVSPVPWKTFGPAFYVTFHNWLGNEDYDDATQWLEEHHGPGVYWMGEPCLGELVNITPEDAYEMVRPAPAIREMRWNCDD